jgi:hypothetical protein
MKFMGAVVPLVGMSVLVPYIAFAGTECRSVEFPDHYEAVCLGDKADIPATARLPAQSGPAAAQPAAATQGAAPLAEKPSAQTPSAGKTATPVAAGSNAVKTLLDFRKHRLQRADVEAKKSVRMKVIQEERRNRPDAE